MNHNIMIINNNEDNQKYIKSLLTKKNYTLDFVNDGVEGIIQHQTKMYDLIILDIAPKNLDGFNICKIIRAYSTIPMIMLSSVIVAESYEIKGFQLGIDDFIMTDYCSVELFLYRIEAVLRRQNLIKTTKLLKYNEIYLNPDSHIVYVNNKKIELTTKEFGIFHLFIKNPGKVLSREYLIYYIWGDHYYGNYRIIDVYIKKLRKKLDIPYIKTVTGVGYKLDT